VHGLSLASNILHLQPGFISANLNDLGHSSDLFL